MMTAIRYLVPFGGVTGFVVGLETYRTDVTSVVEQKVTVLWER